MPPSNSNGGLPAMRELNRILAPFQTPEWKPAVWQLINTLLPYAALMALMMVSLRGPYIWTLLLAVPTGLFLVRTFILFHDCGHNSFTPSKQANKLIGFFLGIMTFTPSESWWFTHAVHQATSGNLDKRGMGDVETWTVEEYRSKPWAERVGYNLFRYPFIMFGLGPIWMFLIAHRFAIPQAGRKGLLNVIWTNLALVVYVTALSFAAGGLLQFLAVQVPVMWVGGMIGIWMFYVQHQFEGVYWARDAEWDYVASALKGASYYHLPKVLQWFSGNIGFHHIHHLSPRIPNYKLEAAHKADTILQVNVREIGMLEAIRTVRLRLIDEKNNNRLVSFQDIMG